VQRSEVFAHGGKDKTSSKQKIESRLKKACICVEEREREVKFWISRVKKMEEKR